MSLKSVHITNYYHKNSGGISTAYNKLLEAANRHRREVRLIVPGAETTTENVGEFGKIYYVKADYSPIFDKRYRVMLPWKTYIFDKAPIKKILRDEKPEIIEIGEKYSLSLMAGLMRRGILNVSVARPMLIHFSCERMDDNIASFVSEANVLKWFSRRIMGNYNFPMFDFHIANSTYTAQELFDSISRQKNPRRFDSFFNWCWRLFRAAKVPAAERVFVNQCGVDNETFSVSRKDENLRRRILQENDLPENAKILLYAGRISPEKNVGLLIEMMRILAKDEHRDFRLLVAGAGPKADWLQAETDKLFPGKIVLLGHLEKETLAAYYANADVFVHPNPREPFGIAPLEAMASAIPVVAPNAGGVLSYATDENAWLAEPNAESFAAAVREIVENENLRTRKIAAALETARNNTREKSTDNLFAAYDKMYEDFQRRRELFTDGEKAKDFDFTKLV